jgi:hypothetical protein
MTTQNVTDAGVRPVQRPPIALFAFKRPEHTRRTLQALQANEGLQESPLYIFCDAARHPGERPEVEAVRVLVRAFEHPNKVLVEQSINQGLAASIIHGVSRLCAEYGQVIVLEDDLVVAPGFLNFMHQALVHYAHTPQVMQVSGHAFAVPAFDAQDPVLLLPFVGSWGWATWDRAWRQFDAQGRGWEVLLRDAALRRRFDLQGAYPYTNMLTRQMLGQIDSWAIRWNWSVFKAEGLVVYPSVSFVENIGFDGSGTHCRDVRFVGPGVLSTTRHHLFPEHVQVDPLRYQQVRQSVQRAQGPFWRRCVKRCVHGVQRWLHRFQLATR